MGEYNIRENGKGIERNVTENINIVTKKDKPGIDIIIKENTKNESVHIPVIITQGGLTDIVYNDFYIGKNADVVIVAGCGIHNSTCSDSRHDGIHRFFLEENAKVKYIEKHYGEGEGTGKRVLNPQTVIDLKKGANFEMESVQIKGVDSTIRETIGYVAEDANLTVTERIMTHGEQVAKTIFNVELDGDDSSAHDTSRSVAADNSKQYFISKTVKDYFKPLKLNCLNLYKDFITNINDMPNLKKQTLKSIKSKEFCFEDLPALFYFDMVFNGTENLGFNKYAHVIIDEAQDLGMFHYWVLKSIFNNATFSIFGDQAQSIYPSRGIESWEDVKTEVFNDNCEVLNLNKSYRTTMEITNSANQILDYLNLTEAKPVIRTGYNVEYYNQDTSNINDKILDLICNYNEKGYKSIGIICRSEEECLEKYSYLNNEGLTSSLISNEDSEYKGGICVLTSELSKGLEFDGVIITNASEENYSSRNMIDMKLLYVAMTRALHSLNILYTDQLTRPLSNNMSKENGKELIKKI